MTNPLVAQAPAEGSGFNQGTGDNGWATGFSIAESAMDTFNGFKDGSWIEGSLGVVGLAADAASMAIDPFGTLLSSAASFLMEHVQPLKDMLDWLAGNPPVIDSYSTTWNNVSTELGKIAEDYANALKSGTAGWTGAAADAYRGKANEQADAIAGAASAAGSVGTVVGLMGMVVAFVREMVRDLIADLVAKLITWVLEAVFSLGFGTPVIVAQAITAISKWAARIAKLVQKLLDTIKKVSPMLKRLVEIFEKIMKVLGKIAGKATGLDVLGTKIDDPGFLKKLNKGDADLPHGTPGSHGSSSPDGSSPHGTSPDGTSPDTGSPSTRSTDTTSTSSNTTTDSPDTASRPGRGPSDGDRPSSRPESDGAGSSSPPPGTTGAPRPAEGSPRPGSSSQPSSSPAAGDNSPRSSNSPNSGSSSANPAPSTSSSPNGGSPSAHAGASSSPSSNSSPSSGSGPSGGSGPSSGSSPSHARTDQTNLSATTTPEAPPRVDQPHANPRDTSPSPQQSHAAPTGGAPQGGGGQAGGAPTAGGQPRASGGGGWTGTSGTRGDVSSGVPTSRSPDAPSPAPRPQSAAPSSFGPSNAGPSHVAPPPRGPQSGPPNAGPTHPSPPNAGPTHANAPQAGPPQGRPQAGPPHAGPTTHPGQAGPPHGGPPPGRPPQAGQPHAGTTQAGPPRTGSPSAGPSHAGPPQAGPPHTGSPNAGAPHAGAPSGNPPHAGSPQTRPPQAGPPHTGPSHTSPSQAGRPQAGPPHAGPPNANPPHAGPPNAGPPHQPAPQPRGPQPSGAPHDRGGLPPQREHGPGGPRDRTEAPHRDPDAGPHRDSDGSPDSTHGDPNHDPNTPDHGPRPDIDEAHARHGETTPAGISHHRGDSDMGDLPQRVPNDPRYFTADVHITPDGRARIGNHTYSPEEYGDLLRRNGWDGKTPIRLIGCDAGSNDFAKRLSAHTDAPVLAPTKPAWTDSKGRVFTSDAEVDAHGNRQPKIPPNGEWETHHPDGTRAKASEDGFAPGTHDADKTGLDPHDAKDRGEDGGSEDPPDAGTEDGTSPPAPRSDDPAYDKLIDDNKNIRETPYTDDANRKIKNKWPERTISNGTATGTVDGKQFDQDFAVTSGEERLLKGTAGEHLPALPPEGHRIFRTREFEGTSRAFDSEPKAFEKLARDILETGSGKTRQEVEDAIKDAIDRLPKGADGYPASAKDIIDDAARQLGVDLDAVDIKVDMVIDFPRGRREGLMPEDQICASCQDLMDDFEVAFRDKVSITAKNPNDDTMWS